MNRFTSRKFLVTSLSMIAATIMAAKSLLTPDLAMVYMAGITAYNAANAGMEYFRSK